MKHAEQRADPYDGLAVVGKAFASPRRLELMELMAQGERTVESLARETRMGVSTTSAHLQILKLSRLVRTRREGTRVFYRLAGDDVLRLYAAMRDVARTYSADVDAALASYLGEAGLDDVAQVSREELVDRLSDHDLVLIDVRPPEEYAAGHIPHARSVPLDELASRTEVEHLGDVVAYCRGAWCVLAHDAVRLLAARGTKARRMEGGMLEWRTAGYPVEVGA